MHPQTTWCPCLLVILVALPQTGTQIFGKYIVVRFHSAESPGVLDSADFQPVAMLSRNSTVFFTGKTTLFINSCVHYFQWVTATLINSRLTEGHVSYCFLTQWASFTMNATILARYTAPDRNSLHLAFLISSSGVKNANW